jgi:hypothetical protein
MDVSEPSGNRAENVMFTAFREESTSRFEAGRVNSGVGSTATRAAATLAAAVIDAAPTLALPVQSVSTRQAANLGLSDEPHTLVTAAFTASLLFASAATRSSENTGGGGGVSGYAAGSNVENREPRGGTPLRLQQVPGRCQLAPNS